MDEALRGVAVVAHGGGPTHVINASLAGVHDECGRHSPITALYGARHGIAGVIEEEFIDLSKQNPERMAGIGRAPSSALGSTRRKVSKDDYERILAVFRAHNVRYFFYNGGNDSMDTANRIAHLARETGYELRTIGIPKTIDNDLAKTDHCPGYGSAACFIACALRDIGEDNRALPAPVEVVEVMGRNAGWLVAATALARGEPDDAPHLIYLPERRLPAARLMADVQDVHDRLGHVVIAVCEGQLDENGEPFGADVATADGFQHRMTGNLGHVIGELITKNLKLRSRSGKPRLLGRSSAPFASASDRDEAYLCGQAAVRAAVGGESDRMVSLVREPGPDYRCTTTLVPLEEVANLERLFPEEWIHPSGNDVLPPFLDYVRPLAGAVAPNARLEDFRVGKRVAGSNGG